VSRAWLLGVLAALVGGGLAASWVLGKSERPARAPATTNDDLDLVLGLLDGAASEPLRDVLVAATAERYLARAADRAVVAIGGQQGPDDAGHVEGRVAAGRADAGRDAGAERTLAVLDAPARAMALADGGLWIAAGHAVTRVPAAGGPAMVVASGLAGPHAIAADGRWVFVVDVEPGRGGLTHANAVVRFAASGGERVVLGRSEGEVANVALDDVDVYWADCLEGRIVSAPKAGGTTRVLATDRGLPGAIAADADALYWVERRSESLWTMAKAGGTPRQLTQDFAGFANLLVDARGVVWTNEAAVDGAFRALILPRAGGDVTAASSAVDAIDALASDGAHLYWLRGGAVTMVEAR
jgi:hypothetical protein